MTVRTITNLQVDKIMIRKKKHRNSHKNQQQSETRVSKNKMDSQLQTVSKMNAELQKIAETDMSGSPKDNKDMKVKWKIVKQKLQSPKSVLSRENPVKINKRKKSADELIKY